jgi:hypothetical protein
MINVRVTVIPKTKISGIPTKIFYVHILRKERNDDWGGGGETKVVHRL